MKKQQQQEERMYAIQAEAQRRQQILADRENKRN